MPTLVGINLVMLLVFAVLSVATLKSNKSQSEVQDDQDAALVKQQASLTGGCKRLGIVADQLNSLNSRVYGVITLSQDSPSVGDLKQGLADVTRESPATARLLTSLLLSGAKAGPLYKDILDNTSYIPPNNCKEATEHPGTWVPPEPVPFRQVVGCYDPVTNPRPPAKC